MFYLERLCTPPSVLLASWRHGLCDEVVIMERMGGLPFFPWRHRLCDVVVIMERTGGNPFFSWRHGLCDVVVAR